MTFLIGFDNKTKYINGKKREDKKCPQHEMRWSKIWIIDTTFCHVDNDIVSLFILECSLGYLTYRFDAPFFGWTIVSFNACIWKSLIWCGFFSLLLACAWHAIVSILRKRKQSKLVMMDCIHGTNGIIGWTAHNCAHQPDKQRFCLQNATVNDIDAFYVMLNAIFI